MADATSPERAVVETWRDYSAALEQVRHDELRTLTPRDALAAADALLDLVRMLPLADGLSGLVEQQRIFRRAVV